MSEPLKRIQDQLSEALSRQQADQIVFRIALQTLFCRIVSAQTDFAEEMLDDLRTTSLRILSKLEIETANPESSFDPKKLTTERAEQFFDEIAVALAAVRQKRGESGRN